MPATVEIIGIIVRQGPDHHKYGDPFAFAVAGSGVDGRTIVLKALTQGTLPVTKQAVSDVITAVEALGLGVNWERMRDMKKEKIAHASAATSDAEHFAAAKHAIEQIGHGHYGVKNVSITQTDLGNGEVQFSATFVRFETDTSVEASDRA